MGSNYRLIGLDSIAFGPAYVATAGMPTAANLTSVGAIVPDSAVLAIEMPGKTELMVEDSDFADIVVNEPGGASLEFATRDFTPENLRIGMGGTTTATLWRAPNDPVVVTERCVKAISKSYGGKKVRVDIVRGALRGGGQLRFSKTESGMLSYQLDVLRPHQPATDYPIVVAIQT